MRKFIACLLLVALLGIISPLLSAQQNQSTQRSNTEIEVLKKRVSELEKQLQIVENVEKMELQAKLAEANAKLAEANTKLINADFDAFKKVVRVDIEERMRAWSYWFFGILGIIAVISGTAIWFSLKSLIADRVEKNLNGFKEAVDAQNAIKSELRILKKEHAASVLMDFHHLFLKEEHKHSGRIKSLSEEDLLQVFEDERYGVQRKYQAAAVLVARKSARIISPMLLFLNSVADTDSNIDYSGTRPHEGVTLLAQLHTPEVYQGLTKFLNRLLTENAKHKDLFLKETIFSLADVSVKLNIGDSVPFLKLAIPHLKDLEPADLQALEDVAKYFDIFNDPVGIKDILNHHTIGEIPGLESSQKQLENRCLELLQKHDPQFVEEWRASTTDSSNA